MTRSADRHPQHHPPEYDVATASPRVLLRPPIARPLGRSPRRMRNLTSKVYLTIDIDGPVDHPQPARRSPTAFPGDMIERAAHAHDGIAVCARRRRGRVRPLAWFRRLLDPPAYESSPRPWRGGGCSNANSCRSGTPVPDGPRLARFFPPSCTACITYIAVFAISSFRTFAIAL